MIFSHCNSRHLELFLFFLFHHDSLCLSVNLPSNYSYTLFLTLSLSSSSAWSSLHFDSLLSLYVTSPLFIISVSFICYITGTLHYLNKALNKVERVDNDSYNIYNKELVVIMIVLFLFLCLYIIL